MIFRALYILMLCRVVPHLARINLISTFYFQFLLNQQKEIKRQQYDIDLKLDYNKVHGGN